MTGPNAEAVYPSCWHPCIGCFALDFRSDCNTLLFSWRTMSSQSSGYISEFLSLSVFTDQSTQYFFLSTCTYIFFKPFKVYSLIQETDWGLKECVFALWVPKLCAFFWESVENIFLLFFLNNFITMLIADWLGW